jgi:hypothetical protein
MIDVTESLKKSNNNIPIFELFPNAGGDPIALNKGVAELHYYENILSESIRISAVVVDTGNASPANDGTGASIGFAEALKIGNGEKIYLQIEDGFNPPNKLSFITEEKSFHLNQTEKISEHTQKSVFSLDIVSKEFLKNELSDTRVVKRYDGKISDHIEKILKENLKTEKELDIEVTENRFNFIGTTKKPFWTIYWLAKKSIPNIPDAFGKTAGFLFFETADGYKFKSVDKLFDRIAIKKYIFNNTTSTIVPVGYDGKILNYESTDSSDFQSKLQIGTYNSENKGVDAFESFYNQKPIDLDLQEPVVITGGTDFKFVNKEFTNFPSRFSWSLDSVGFLPDGNSLTEQLKKSKELDIDKQQIQSRAASRYNQLFTVTLKITLAGDFSLRAGDLIHCDFPELSTKPNPSYNPRMSGVYMISALCHSISNNETYTNLELIRDSYGRKPAQM